jgi:sphingolipid delta-4 desaturase
MPPNAAAPSRDFEWSYTDEPHATRRQQIMAKYPQVKKLFGYDPVTKYKVMFAVAAQLCMCRLVRDLSWPTTLVLCYVVGGTINHAMTLAMHEISHGLAFRKMRHNRIFGMVANLPLGIPASASFKRYHADHHRYQGLDVIDADVPTVWETKFFNTTIKKILWMLLQPAFYALRPLVCLPKAPQKWEVINFIMQATFDLGVYHFFGSKGLTYLILGTLLGMGIHPMAGHFVAEHYTFIKGQETYSYYGPLNFFSFNVGYHNEHHDFPFIPGSRLPTLRAMAPEFYDTLPYHESWSAVIWQYITDPDVGPWSRIKRSRKEGERLKLD